jgi:hypothetical protein
MRNPVIGMTTDMVSRNPAVSHCPTLASICSSCSSTGSATAMVVSLRIATKAETSSTPITVRSRALSPVGGAAALVGSGWVVVTVFPLRSGSGSRYEVGPTKRRRLIGSPRNSSG